MKALILVAHGSRREAANDEFGALVEAVSQLTAKDFDLVLHGFLEIAQPDLPAVIGQAVQRGATSIKILPFFLGSGRHVSRDIPGVIGAVEEMYPKVNFTVTPHLGASEEILEALAALAAH